MVKVERNMSIQGHSFSNCHYAMCRSILLMAIRTYSHQGKEISHFLC